MKRLLVAALLAIACVALAEPAGAQGPGEVITNYDVEMVIGSDGVVSFTETIDYDFGSSERHGIFRDLVRQERYDSENDRTYDIDVTGVTMDGSSVPVDEGSDGDYLRLRIGDPDSTITGQHTYVISYEVRGAITPFSEHDELYWDAIGNQWQVPILAATSTVTSPAPIERYLCFSGPQGSTLPCDTATAEQNTARFSANGLGLGSGMTVVVAVPKSAITPAPEVLLSERYDIAEAFSVTPVTAPLASGIAILGVGGMVYLVWRRGRDRRWTGSAVDAAFGNTSGGDERIPIGQRDAGPVEFVPPDGVRPGQVGTLIDERANLLDVTATIVDLAVRGHLKIVEVDTDERTPEYELKRLDGGKGELLPYEQTLRDALFASGPTVRLSDLKYEFTEQLGTVKQALYADVVEQGWYRSSPEGTRLAWRALGVLLTLVGIGLTVVFAIWTKFALVPIGIIFAGLALLGLGGRMPARTAKGSAMFSRIRGFRRLFDEGEQDVRERFAEQEGIFSQYLPYAIVFGCTERWARAFEGLDAQQLGTTGWYTSPYVFSALAFSHAVDHFGVAATGTLYTSAPSSSSSSGFSGGGFSGGGGGGGGGGSW
jgi:uncharacterized membrane protein YgcG